MKRKSLKNGAVKGGKTKTKKKKIRLHFRLALNKLILSFGDPNSHAICSALCINGAEETANDFLDGIHHFPFLPPAIFYKVDSTLLCILCIV